MKRVLEQKLRNIKLIVTDFDGVWTDGKVFVDENGRESVLCSRKDTLRLKEVRALGIDVCIISKERNPVVKLRCKKMSVQYLQGVDDKRTELLALLDSKKLTLGQVAFVGDDINDLACLAIVSVPITVNDADPRCKAVAHYVTVRNGGDHAMREVFDLVLSVQGK